MTLTVARLYTQGNLNEEIKKIENINLNNNVYKTEQLI